MCSKKSFFFSVAVAFAIIMSTVFGVSAGTSIRKPAAIVTMHALSPIGGITAGADRDLLIFNVTTKETDAVNVEELIVDVICDHADMKLKNVKILTLDTRQLVSGPTDIEHLPKHNNTSIKGSVHSQDFKVDFNKRVVIASGYTQSFILRGDVEGSGMAQFIPDSVKVKTLK